MMSRSKNKAYVIVRPILLASFLIITFALYHLGKAAAQIEVNPSIFLPFTTSAWDCPSGSANSYASGPAFQFDQDNPVRPAWNHADKNLSLRGYNAISKAGLHPGLVDYGSDDPNQPPQLATLLKPARVPEFTHFYRINQWQWASSPDPGFRQSPITLPKVTALGLKINRGEPIYVPTSGYSIGGGMEVLVLYADQTSVTLRYTREDSAGARGYTVYISSICTDANLLKLYRKHDSPSGPRYKYVPPEKRPYSYNLPNLPAGKVIGTAMGDELVVAVSDSGRFWDPRSCNEWWQIRPGYSSSCPPPNY